LIPNSAIIQKGELASVFVKRDQGYDLRQVRLGQRYDNQIEVLSGLRVGETVSVNGYKTLAAQEAK